jgi:hypothetical protein
MWVCDRIRAVRSDFDSRQGFLRGGGVLCGPPNLTSNWHWVEVKVSALRRWPLIPNQCWSWEWVEPYVCALCRLHVYGMAARHRDNLNFIVRTISDTKSSVMGKTLFCDKRGQNGRLDHILEVLIAGWKLHWYVRDSLKNDFPYDKIYL